MTKQKELSPDSSSAQGADNSSNSSGSDGMSSSRPHPLSNNLHLQVPTRSNSDSSQSSPSPRTSTSGVRGRSGSGGRGSSISSTFSTEISYRDLSDIQDEFKIVKILHDGSFSKILLARQNHEGGGGSSSTPTDTKNGKRSMKNSSNNNKYLVLKAIPSGGLFTDDFQRELRYNYFLSPHPHILTSFSSSFNWASSYNVYVQEFAKLGDLAKHISTTSQNKKCLQEFQVKMIGSQLASALEFMHSFNLVFQNVQPENVLVFKSNFSIVKICGFGSTRREGTLITKGHLLTSSCSSFLPPELSYLLPQEKFESHRSTDVWQMGVLLCLCLTGRLPWNQADFTDPAFRHYTNWLKRKSLKVPDIFRRFSPRLTRLMKRLLEPKLKMRSEIREILKYLDDDWIKSNCNRVSSNGSSLRRGSCAKHESRNNSAAPVSGTNKSNKNKIIKLTNKINIQNTNPDENDGIEISKIVDRDRSEEVEESITKRVEHWIASAIQSEEKIHGTNNCESLFQRSTDSE